MVLSKSLLRWLAAASATVALIAIGFTAQTASASVSSCSGTGGTFAGGAGTSADPYLVSNQTQLETIRSSSYYTCAFKQTADIELSGSWTPIGDSYSTRFVGEYDGDGKRITGLNVSSSGGAYLGFFGYTEDALIKNMRLAGTVSVPGGFGIGALVGLADRPTTIINVHSSVDVTGQGRIGGLVGWLAESTISRSSSTGSVTGASNHVGGLVGLARSAYNNLSSGVSNSYATGPVTSTSNSVGVAGLIGGAEITAVAPYELSVLNSYATGLVTGGTGGSGTSGGLIGPQSGGTPYFGLTVTESFWDTQTTGKSTSADGQGTGKTIAEMKAYSTFNNAMWDITNGWSDSTFWGICDGSTYPFLSAQYTATPCEFALSVSKTGTGSGTVTSSPSGVDCGSDCTEIYDRDTQVTLAATAVTGSSFTEWSSSDPSFSCPGTGACTVTMDQARTVSATFTADPPTPTPTPTPSTEPKLRVSMGGAERVSAGEAFKLGMLVRNTGTGPARDVVTCLTLPKTLFLVRSKGARATGRSICWTRSSLGAGKSASYRATVRSSSTSEGALGVRATVRASNASGGSVSTGGEAEIRVVKPKPEPKPEPPTG
ncbi:MAG: InlB B-repeat-containing protein [Solirubrobacterales bacterium]